MRGNHTEIVSSIRSIVGPDRVIENPAFKIGDLSPRLVVRPSSASEVAECLKVFSQFDAAVIPAGQMSWLECGNPLRRADVVVCLDQMRRIIDYSPADLTATVEAGVSLREFNEVAIEQRQWLPLDPPGFATASLGAITACNSSGTLRLGFGSPRDYVIGMKLAHADGSESKSGGRVVKNVAGYDLNKLYVGSYGTLAIITELTFKLRPLAERTATLMITSRYRGPLFLLARKILGSELQPASIVLTRALSAAGIALPADALLIRFIDSDASVEHQLQAVRELADQSHETAQLNEAQAETIWSQVADFEQYSTRLRLSVPLSAVPAEFEKVIILHLECVACADIGAGIIRVAFDADESTVVEQIERIRASVIGAGGTLVIEKGSGEARRRTEAWGDAGSTAVLMRALKEKFDPQSLLNPGMFVAGI